MYDFAIVALVALALIKVVDVIVDLVKQETVPFLRSILTLAGGIGAVWLLDYSMFAGFDVAVRSHAVGVWLTGFMVAGLTIPWRAMFGYLTDDRATADETLGDHGTLRRAA